MFLYKLEKKNCCPIDVIAKDFLADKKESPPLY
jgi:hypothetical protein